MNYAILTIPELQNYASLGEPEAIKLLGERLADCEVPEGDLAHALECTERELESVSSDLEDAEQEIRDLECQLVVKQQRIEELEKELAECRTAKTAKSRSKKS